MNKKDLRKKILHSISFGLIEQILNIILGFIISVITIRYLSRSNFGLISYAASFFAIINFINIAPENYLFKINNKIENEVEYLKSYEFFSIFKSLLIFIIFLIIGIAISIKNNNITYLLVFLSNSIFFSFNQIANIYKVKLELEFKQKIITLSVLLGKTAKAILIIFLIYTPKIEIVLISQILEVVVYVIYRRRYLKRVLDFNKKISFSYAYNIIKKSSLNYSIWTHLMGVITNFIYKIDPFILGFFVSMEQIGTYSIALKISNYFIIIFQLLQKNSLIALSNISKLKEKNNIIFKFNILSIILSILQFVLFLFLGKHILALYVNKDEIEIVYNYMFYILFGLSIINGFRPLISYLTLIDDVKKVLFYCIIPSGIFTFIIYIISAYKFGTIGIAKANVLAYFFWTILLIARTVYINLKNEVH